jgi:LAO/AO transport system kinase
MPPASVPSGSVPSLFERSRRGDRAALARLLSLVERGGEPFRAVAAIAYRSGGETYSVGITGAPGAGKSTLTDRLIGLARTEGLERPDRVAVLAIDPSSPFSGGAILGDRVRMSGHALDDGVYIRSMATRGHLGGLAVAVPDVVRVLAAVGMPVVLVETVGVGQQEVGVAAATDTTVVVVNPGWGDSVQANKAGLLEIADLFVINKADRPGGRETHRDLETMLGLTDFGDWVPRIVETVASTGDGVARVWETIREHRRHQMDQGTLDRHRRLRLERELRQILDARVGQRIDELAATDEYVRLTESMVEGGIDPYDAADRILADGFGPGR